MSGIQVVDGRLVVDGVDVALAAGEFGTPMFLYGGDSIAAGVAGLKESIGDDVEIYYSIKANPAIGVCRLIERSGVDGAEIASSGELVAVMASGFDPARILFAGPGKTDGELEHAIGAGVGQVNAESVGEIERIDAVAGRLGVVQRVGIRVNLAAEGSGHGKIRTGGGAQKFGIDESGVVDAIGLIGGLEHVEFGGLHTMLGSQVLDAWEMLRSCELGIEMAIRIGTASGVEIKSLNFGGGLGVSHRDDEDGFDLDGFGRGLSELILKARKTTGLTGTRFMIEPGRVLVSEYGVYVSRVVDVKVSGGETFAIVDGGIHHALLPITANSYRVVVADRVESDDTNPVMLGGPLCTSADQWRSSVELPGVQVGDVVAMMNSGGYGLTASMSMFLSRGTPTEVLVVGGDCSVIRERSSVESVLDGQSIPQFLE